MSRDFDLSDRIRAVLVMLATIGTIAFGYVAAGSRFGLSGWSITDRYTTILSPAEYGYSIWALIYFGLAAFSIYQLLPANLARFRTVRTLYIFACALSCGWLFFLLNDRTGVSLVLILILEGVLIFLVSKFRWADNKVEYWALNAPFGLYAGWIAVLTTVTVFAYAASSGFYAGPGLFGAVFILILTASAVIIRWRFYNYFYALAIAWGLTAIAVRQSGNTMIVVTAVLGVIVCLVAALSFVMNMPIRKRNLENNE